MKVFIDPMKPRTSGYNSIISDTGESLVTSQYVHESKGSIMNSPVDVIRHNRKIWANRISCIYNYKSEERYNSKGKINKSNTDFLQKIGTRPVTSKRPESFYFVANGWHRITMNTTPSEQFRKIIEIEVK